ncbi:OmpA family protein [Saccharomonospora xinjiangensis]|uniref:OmpA family protein n=1 Tax=Saccharomonospora xinjiangensis TaxID=75294 RepID=UPI0010706274|nr:OmpA family protein [Saccharomonospora xinjiangensis]QBQ62191.1 Outer membrane porin F precursor [Saccharomonospora xinjiangensis]
MPAPRLLAAFAALAVLVTGVLALVATVVERGGIEADLTARSREALSRSGLPAEAVSFSGRDATVQARSPHEALLAESVVEDVDGVRSVDVVISGGHGGPPTPQRGAAPADPGASAKARLQRSLDEVLADNPITFRPYSSDLTSGGEDAVARVAETLSGAPTDWRFEVAGHTARVSGADPESAEELSYARAEAVAEELVDLGVPPDQVKPVGYGDTRPLSRHGTSAIDRRVEISVR